MNVVGLVLGVLPAVDFLLALTEDEGLEAGDLLGFVVDILDLLVHEVVHDIAL